MGTGEGLIVIMVGARVVELMGMWMGRRTVLLQGGGLDMVSEILLNRAKGFGVQQPWGGMGGGWRHQL